MARKIVEMPEKVLVKLYSDTGARRLIAQGWVLTETAVQYHRMQLELMPLLKETFGKSITEATGHEKNGWIVKGDPLYCGKIVEMIDVGGYRFR